MPTARELLEQADALMRRNRARAVDTDTDTDTDTDIPELTDAIPDAVVLPAVPTTLDEVPELTDAVEEIEIASIVELPEDRDMPSEWLRLDRDAVIHADESAFLASAESSAVPPAEAPVVPPAETPTGPVAETPPPAAEPEPATQLPRTVSIDMPAAIVAPIAAAAQPELVVASVSIEGAPAATPPGPTAPALPVVPEGPVDEWARWQALAEEIRMQVLQRIDIFTDTGLREQLGAQLQPIIERASADMIATINEQVGTLLRAYIAEAIEREIEKWRRGNE